VIGIISRVDQRAIVEEFFELFKTPWEHYVPGRSYDVVLSTTDQVPEADARLIISFGASQKPSDRLVGITVFLQAKKGPFKYGDVRVPVYGDLAWLQCDRKASVELSWAQGAVGIRGELGSKIPLIRLGYDVFEEARSLLGLAQPIEYASVPTLDIHIEMLRNWIVGEGIPLVEICAAPADHHFIVCLTHDIDFVGIRNHIFDQTMWGFIYRSTLGALRNVVRGRIGGRKFLKTLKAVASLPFVFLGWMEDFWSPFEWYLEVEKGLAATYYLIPFKGRAGERVPGRHAARRAAAYDARGLGGWVVALKEHGNEIGVHGIDAWHSVEKGKAELKRVEEVAGHSTKGVRMHWLLQDDKTHPVLEEAGFEYDASAGYNETVGYRNGTTQVFRPLNAKKLLELPTHIQDGALFYPNRLDLSESEAQDRCNQMIDNNKRFGGVLTLIWHDRSHAPERFWGDFYVNLVQTLKDSGAFFASAAGAVDWFRKRREVHFEQNGGKHAASTLIRYEGEEIRPPLRIRLYNSSQRTKGINHSLETPVDCSEISWNGIFLKKNDLQSLSRFLEIAPNLMARQL